MTWDVHLKPCQQQMLHCFSATIIHKDHPNDKNFKNMKYNKPKEETNTNL